MTRMTRPDCAVMGNLINTHTHTHTHTHTQKKFGVRVKGSRNLGLTEGDGQSFVFWNGMYGKATGGARRFLSWLVTWS